MNPTELIAHIRGLDVQLFVDNRRFRLNAPMGTVTPELAAALTEQKAEIVHLLDSAEPVSRSLRLVPTSREGALPLSFVQERIWMLAQLQPDSTAYNLATLAQITDDGPVTIGRPIANTRVCVVDAVGYPVPIGAPGEICIAGDGVARGYYGRAELAAQTFVPEVGRPQAMMYRTGDTGRWRTDRRLEYLGREDGQVKVRGYRIETGEIEAALAADGQSQQQHQVAPEQQSSAETRGALEQVINRDVQLMIGFTSGVNQQYNYRNQLLALLPGLDFRQQLRLEFMPETDHTVSDRISRTEQLQSIGDWMSASFSLSEQSRASV